MKDKVLKYIIENSMVKQGDKVLVALSGGPDSVCLLHILNSLKNELDICIYAAHINHCLRGEEADKDEGYAKELCRKLDIKFYSKAIDINNIANEKGISTELAGREERYKFFNELKDELKLNKIAIAHNLNDQAETIIMRAIRGTGLEGLIGIRPVRENLYIRPILCLSRKEIEFYCGKEDLRPRIDKTNYEDIYARNKIRLKAIPFIEENFNKDIVNTLNRLAYMCNVDNEFIESMVLESYNKYCLEYNKSLIIKKDAFKEKEALLTRVLRKALMNFSGVCNNFEMKHIYDIISFQKGSTGKSINLPNDVKAINSYGDIKLEKNKPNRLKFEDKSITMKINDIISETLDFGLGNAKYSICFEKIKFEKHINFKDNELIKYFDYDKIKNVIIIRKRLDGDKIVPIGMTGTKKIKDIFINLKIPKDKRDEIPIVTFDNKIAWIVGIKVSDEFKINKDTKNLLKISFLRKEF
ncbi:tRNA lysidine(34) synthetase TilS [Clostridium cavendishii]|uniref:tRNA lysidine(34) synthetase TilS n=1 Tax=Clostridium cavendishii TaxID=349931 RepID=UPI00093448D9|nr:tRNA lysidine(34) synthetase TilS [Clostridium cavendishii]